MAPPPLCPHRLFAEPFQFEGDRDTKRPCDFNARSLEDHEEEDEEDEDHAPVRTSKKRTESGSVKQTSSSQARPQEVPVSVSPPPPPHKRARVESIDIPSDATPASSSSAPPLHPALLHSSIQPLLAQTLQSHAPPPNPQYTLAHLYNMVQQQSHSSESPAALLNLLRSGASQSGRFNSGQSNQNTGLSESFLNSLAELASANPGISDGIGNSLGAYGLEGGAGAFDWPVGLGSSSNAQEPQPSTSSSLFFSCVLTHFFTCLLISSLRPRRR